MSVYLASEEQNKVIKSELSLANIIFVDQNIALHTLALSVMDQWKQGNSSIIVMSDEKNRETFQYYLQKMKADSLLLSISLGNTVNENELTKIKKGILPPDTNQRKVYNESKYQYKKNLKKVTEFFGLRYQPLMEGESWREILDQYLMLRPDYNTNILQGNINTALFDFNPEEMASIRLSISDALMIYQRDFEISETLQMHHLLHQESRHPERLEEVTYKLFTFKEIAQGLRDRFNDYYVDLEFKYLQSTFQEINQIIDKIESMKDRLEDDPRSQKKSSVFQMFSSHQKNEAANIEKQLSDWNEMISSLADLKLVKKITFKVLPDNAVDLLNQYLILLNSTLEKKASQKVDYLKSINRFNLNNPIQNKLENDLSALIQQINQSKLLSQQLEVNTLSFAKQLDYITDLVYQIEITLLKIEKNIHYYQWTSFLDDCTLKEKEVLKHLKLIDPTDWIHCFDSWYYYEVLTKDFLHLTSSKDLCYHTILKNHELAYFADTENAINLHREKLKQVLDQLKNSNQELYAAITKNKKLPLPLLWKFCLGQNIGFLSAVFPIILVDDAQLEQISAQENQHLYIFESAIVNPDILQPFKSVYSYFPKDNFKGNANYELSQHSLNLEKKLHEITVSDRLPLVRSLCDIMLSMDKKPEVFLMRDATIVSYASTFINQILERKFYDLGIKKIFIEDAPHQSLLGALLDSERFIYIIAEDGMINQQNSELFLWQLHSYQLMKIAGCQVLDINTSELLVSKGQMLETLVALIKANQKTGITKETKQLTVEFN